MYSMLSFCWYLAAVMIGLAIGKEIDPANYIWINFNKQVPITLNANNEYQTYIPCESRIGKCSYNYQITPPNWKRMQNGSLIIPAQDANKEGFFAITVNLSEPTGEKLSASLVAKTSKGFMTVMDSTQFYKQTGYTNKNAQNTKYEQSPMVKGVPAGFLTLKQVEDLISSNSEQKINSFMQDTGQKFAPCRSKANYFKSVKQIFQKTISANDKKVSNNKLEIASLEERIKQLKQERVRTLKKQGVDRQIQTINAKILIATNEFVSLSSQYLKYRGLCQEALRKLKQDTSKILANNNQKLDTNKEASYELEKLEGKFNDWLVQAIQNRSSLQKGLLSIKLLMSTKNTPNNPQVKQIQRNFRSIMTPLVEAQAKLTQTEIKQLDLTQEREQDNNFLKFIDEKLTDVNNKLLKLSPEDQRESRLKAENQLLSLQIKKIQDYMSKMSSNCLFNKLSG